MFSNLNPWEIGGLLLLALFIFGPERLPKVIGDAARMIKTVRDMARNAAGDLSKELGTDVSIEDLHPKTFIRKHLLSEEDEATLRRPFDDAFRDLRQVTNDTADQLNGHARQESAPARQESAPAPRTGDVPAPLPGPAETRYDSDAT